MLKKADLIKFACERTILEAGIAEASRAAAQPGRFPAVNSFDRIRLRTADSIAELALLRCVVDRAIPHRLSPAPDFIRTGRYDLSLGGRRCLPVAQMICRRSTIRRLARDDDGLLAQKLYLPEQIGWDVYSDEDLFVFVFLSTLVTRSREATKRALVAEEPLHLLFQMPASWSLPEHWSPMRNVVLKTDLSSPAKVTLHGQDGRQRYLSQQIRLEGRTRTEAATELFSIGALEIDRLPNGPLGLHHRASGETLLVAPYQWGNVWLYVLRVVLAGYIRRGDFYRQAERASLAEALAVNPCLKDESLLSLPVSELKPLPALFRKTVAWAGKE